MKKIALIEYSFIRSSIRNNFSNDLKTLNTTTQLTHNYKKLVLQNLREQYLIVIILFIIITIIKRITVVIIIIIRLNMIFIAIFIIIIINIFITTDITVITFRINIATNEFNFTTKLKFSLSMFFPVYVRSLGASGSFIRLKPKLIILQQFYHYHLRCRDFSVQGFLQYLPLTKFQFTKQYCKFQSF